MHDARLLGSSGITLITVVSRHASQRPNRSTRNGTGRGCWRGIWGADIVPRAIARTAPGGTTEAMSSRGGSASLAADQRRPGPQPGIYFAGATAKYLNKMTPGVTAAGTGGRVAGTSNC